jgi:hypothetical protein
MLEWGGEGGGVDTPTGPGTAAEGSEEGNPGEEGIPSNYVDQALASAAPPLAEEMHAPPLAEEIHREFNKLDTDGSGCLSRDEFRAALGGGLTDDEFEQMWGSIDMRSNSLDVHEFSDWLRGGIGSSSVESGGRAEEGDHT